MRPRIGFLASAHRVHVPVLAFRFCCHASRMARALELGIAPDIMPDLASLDGVLTHGWYRPIFYFLI